MRYANLLPITALLAAAACTDEAEQAQNAQAATPRSLLELERGQARSTLAADKTRHDFGQRHAGHGAMPELERSIAPGASFDVRVTFDPAAHEPQGLGNVMRAVNIHTRDGGPG